MTVFAPEPAFAESERIPSTALYTRSFAESVGWIGQRCFKDCASLFSIVLPQQVEFIEEGAFEGCSALETVVLPAALTHVESAAFAGTGLSPDDMAFPESCELAPDAF